MPGQLTMCTCALQLRGSLPCAHARCGCGAAYHVHMRAAAARQLTMCTCALWLRGSWSTQPDGKSGDALASAPGVAATCGTGRQTPRVYAWSSQAALGNAQKRHSFHSLMPSHPRLPLLKLMPHTHP